MKPVPPTALLAVFLLAACSPQAVSPSPTAMKPSPPPSVGATSSPSPIPTPTETTPLNLSAIQRLSPRVGYIAGWTGTDVGLAKTGDGGATWKRIPIPVSSITALRFIDERVGWAAGSGVVLRTEDGGNTWQTVLAIPTQGVPVEPIQQIQAVDGQRAWVLALDPACQYPCLSNLQRTTDSGRTWTTLLHGQITAIRFASASRGWAALDNAPSPGTAEVLKTSDGGSTWVTGLRTASGGVYGLDAATIYTAWLLTRDGGYCSSSNCTKYTLFRTDNGGLNWANLGNPKDFVTGCSTGGHLAGPLFASTGRGWLGLNTGAGGANVGPTGILKSEDGGRTWRCATTPRQTSFISAADPFHVWALSDYESALYATEDAGTRWHPLNLSSLQSP